jgi:hypothetical protein
MRRMGSLVVLAAVVLSACSKASAPVAHVSATASAHGSPTSAASPTPTSSSSGTTLPFLDLPLSTVSFSCRLPIYTEGTVIEDSFITFPDGAISPTPVGTGGMYFDRAFSRWLPVPRSAVSPDGISYAYVEIGQEPDVFYIHMVGVFGDQAKDVSVQESASTVGLGAQPQVFDYSADGIYLIQAFETTWRGVWLFQPPAGPIRMVSDIAPEVSAGSGVIWFGEVNPADPSPIITGTSAGILPDVVSRLDLRTGVRTRWIYHPGAGLEVLGVDTSSHPLVRVFSRVANPPPKTDPIDHAADELVIALDPSTQRSIYKGQLVETLGNPIADSHGVWFGSAQGIYLYTSSGALIKVSDQPGYPANSCF